MHPIHALSAVALAIAASAVRADDPVSTDGDKYRVLLENEQVRVLGYTDRPGERTHAHAHPAFVIVALDAFERRLELGDGRRVARRFAAGDVMYSAGETHVGENVGTTPTRVVLVELKPASGSCTPARTGR
jgi:hypothetical protein